MCGLVGVVDYRLNKPEALALLGSMMETLSHRGPDGEGVYIEDDGPPVFLGHRRLSIIDPEHGQQPMVSAEGDLVVIFNGVIYNYLELRRELISQGHKVKTYSDTEVILHAYRHWGEDCVHKFNGMFSFAIWDKKKNRIFSARDRIGIKPFYFFYNGDIFVFSSEIKSLFHVDGVNPAINPQGFQDYLTFQYCLGDKTMFKNIKRLEPGMILTADIGAKSIDIKVRKYWDVDYSIDSEHDQEYFENQLSLVMEDAVRLQLRSDVPIGAHLSGGLDSSFVVATSSAMLGGEHFDSFTGAFKEGPKYDETPYARSVADECGTNYHEVFISGADFPTKLPELIYYMDEPAAGPGLFPQYYVSKLAAEKVKVVLGGQGGDEIFIGYARYLIAYLEQCISGAIFETADDSMYAVSLESIVPNMPVLRDYVPLLRRNWGNGLFGDTDRRYFQLIDRSEGISRFISGDGLDNGYSCFDGFRDIFNRENCHSLINKMTYFDMKTSLQALLHVEDRTSMSVGLESRVPLLDHRIIDLMASIPPNIKFAGGRLKHLFRQAARNVVPKKVHQRTDKMGFPTPLYEWTHGESKDFVHDTLLSKRAKERGLYNSDIVEKALEEEGQFGRVVWGLLCVELWHRNFIDGEALN